MRLSDVVGSLGLWVYPVVSLIIFFLVFIAVSIKAVLTSKQQANYYAALPLSDAPEEDTQ